MIPEVITMACKNCGTETYEGDNFCRQCGEEIESFNCECGADVKEGDNYCHACGAALEGVEESNENI